MRLDKIADGARHKVVVFEFNAGNHAQKRALANALAILAIERDGRIPIATSANGLQPDGQNDNGWDQGLLFLNPSQVWLQPPGYVTQMLSRNYLPQLVNATDRRGRQTGCHRHTQRGRQDFGFASSQYDEPGSDAQIHLEGFAPTKPEAQAMELSGDLEAVNTAAEQDKIVPKQSHWPRDQARQATRVFPPRSFTVLRFE